MKQIPNLTLDSSIFHHFPSFSIAMYGYPTRPTFPSTILMMVEAMATIMAKYNWRMPHLDGLGKTRLPGRQD